MKGCFCTIVRSTWSDSIVGKEVAVGRAVTAGKDEAANDRSNADKVSKTQLHGVI